MVLLLLPQILPLLEFASIGNLPYDLSEKKCGGSKNFNKIFIEISWIK